MAWSRETERLGKRTAKTMAVCNYDGRELAGSMLGAEADIVVRHDMCEGGVCGGAWRGLHASRRRRLVAARRLAGGVCCGRSTGAPTRSPRRRRTPETGEVLNRREGVPRFDEAVGLARVAGSA